MHAFRGSVLRMRCGVLSLSPEGRGNRQHLRLRHATKRRINPLAFLRERCRKRWPASMIDVIAASLGRAATRIEDAKLLGGKGRFVDDLQLPGMLHAAFVRSPAAHARLNSTDAAAARQMPGVRAIFTYADLRPALTCSRIPLALPLAAIRYHVDP